MTSRFFKILAPAAALALLASCTSLDKALESDKIDYKSAKPREAQHGLEVPPDLTSVPKDDRFAIPTATTASAMAVQGSQKTVSAADSAVLPQVKDARLERDGSQRWLVVDRKPEDLWPVIREFWQDAGFLIKVDRPEAGILETDYNENRAKIKQDVIRDTLGKLLDGMYSSGEQDKYRTRIERRADGGSEIYISHRGLQEIYSGAQKDTTVWQARPSDPELEAEFLNRLLVRLGLDAARAKSVVNTPVVQANKAHLVAAQGSNPAALMVDEPFDRTWRRVGLALDRVGFTVEDRDRAQGIYFVRFVDPNAEVKEKPGFFGRLFHSTEDDNKQAAQYRIIVKADGSATRVSVLNKDGAADNGSAPGRILGLLNDQLK